MLNDHVIKAYYIRRVGDELKCTRIYGVDMAYNFTKMMGYNVLVGVCCVGLGVSPLVACLGISAYKMCL